MMRIAKLAEYLSCEFDLKPTTIAAYLRAECRRQGRMRPFEMSITEGRKLVQYEVDTSYKPRARTRNKASMLNADDLDRARMYREDAE